MKQVLLKAGKDRRLKAGHLWIYQGEIGTIDIELKSGDLVEIGDQRGRFLGLGYYNQASQIAIRLLTNEREEINRAFFKRRLEKALAYRKRVKPSAISYRLIYGEADLLPGLVVDCFGDYLVVQILTMGMEVNRELIFELLVELFAPAGIVERSDLAVRRLEGLEERAGCVYGECPETVSINDNGIDFQVNLLLGQKTGYFLDQSANRARLVDYVAGRRVLDCFCHVGSFALHAAKYGAASVLGVDISKEAVEMATNNAILNQLAERCRFEEANAFDFLREQVVRKEKYDVVILDPPAFTKSKQAIEGAIRGYKEINLRGLKLLSSGGILVTCSCSHHLHREVFEEIVSVAASDAKKRVRLLERRTQGLDHPILMGMSETEYLKCCIYEIL